MFDLDGVNQIKMLLESIRHTGQAIEEKSIESDSVICENLRSGKVLSDKYLGKSFDDSFNI